MSRSILPGPGRRRNGTRPWWRAAVVILAQCVLSAALAQSPERTLRVAPAITAATELRSALVIGNGAYQQRPLRSPVSDARDVAAALEAAGFRVILRENAGLKAMAEAVRLFGDTLRPGGIGVFYFAGHGAQLRDRNYLIPVDADVQREDEIPYATLDVARVLDKMEVARSSVNVVILDACRNNPFSASFRNVGPGLAQMSAPSGTLIAYATAPGMVALESERRRNGIYTSNLLAQIRTPGMPVELMFKRVREGVSRDTAGVQVPWESSSLRGEFAFFPKTTKAVAERDDSLEIELAYWDSIKASTSRSDYEAYLRQYPSGHFVSLARSRLAAASAGALAQSDAVAPNRAPDVQRDPPKGNESTASPSGGDADSFTYHFLDGFRTRFPPRKLVYAVRARDGGTSSESLAVDGVEVAGDGSGLDFATSDLVSALPEKFDLEHPERIPPLKRRIKYRTEEFAVDFKLQIDGNDRVTVPAGTFQATRLVGTAVASKGEAPIDSTVTIWFAPQEMRVIKLEVRSRAYSQAFELGTFELVEYKKRGGASR